MQPNAEPPGFWSLLVELNTVMYTASAGITEPHEWESKHYHQPSDQVRDDWELSGAIEDVTLYLDLTLHVANAPTMPTWTKGDEFEAVRKASLKIP